MVQLAKANTYSIPQTSLRVQGATTEDIVNEIGTTSRNIRDFLLQLGEIGLIKEHSRYEDGRRLPFLYSPADFLINSVDLPPFYTLLGLNKYTDMNHYRWVWNKETKDLELKEVIEGFSLFHKPYNIVSGEVLDLEGYKKEEEKEGV